MQQLQSKSASKDPENQKLLSENNEEIEKLERKYTDLFRQLDNIEVLREYGIDVPQEELVKVALTEPDNEASKSEKKE